MRKRLTLLAGMGAGYVLGAKAGRARYEQIMTAARSFLDKPAVQETAGVLQGQVTDIAGTAKKVVTEKVQSKVGGQQTNPEPPASTVDLTYSPPVNTTSTYGTGTGSPGTVPGPDMPDPTGPVH